MSRRNMTIKFLNVKGTWREVADAARTTIRQDEGTKEPTSRWKKRILLAEHSPVRKLNFNWKWVDLPYWVSVHFVRHKFGIEHFVSTQRTDRTGVNRDKLPQDNPVIMTGEANVQHLIDTARKRLCRLASRETRKYMEDLKTSIRAVEPEISDVMVPNCIYRCGCPEPACCGWYEAACKRDSRLASTNIQERYDAYNQMFHHAE